MADDARTGVPMCKLVILEANDVRAEALMAGVLASGVDGLDVSIVPTAVEFERAAAQCPGIDIAVIGMELSPNECPVEGRCPSGVELVLRCFPEGSRTQVIYTVDRLELVSHAYRSRHAYLLTWPIEEAALRRALERALDGLRIDAQQPLVVRSDGKVHTVLPCRIVYIESDRRRLHIHTVDRGVLTTYATLDSMARVLPASFAYSHKSFLVNLAFVHAVETDRVVLRNGEAVPVSQRCRRAVREAFAAFAGHGESA